LNRRMGLGALLLVLTPAFSLQKGGWQEQSSGSVSRLRGVSAVNEKVAWASGSQGTCLRTTDGGASWQKLDLSPDAATLDFRDVDAFDAETAYLLSIGEGEKSRIFKTVDGGQHWQLQFTNHNPRAFFDAMSFWDSMHGIAVSDPVEGRFLIISTSDGGMTWKENPADKMPVAVASEGAFAASGSCIAVGARGNAWFGTGGGAARVFRSADWGITWQVSPTPIRCDKPSAGIFSIAFSDAKHGIAVGGDYTNESDSSNNAATTSDGGRTWTLVKRSVPAGFRSVVAYLHKTREFVAAGPSGTDYSSDDGLTWSSLGRPGYHAISFAGTAAGWGVGERGRIGKFEYKNGR
jgi:photosystem II stability/assembly factor-like uncharacterized protein